MKVSQHPDIANALSQAGAAKQQAKATASSAPASQAATQSAEVARGGVPVTFSREARGMEPASRASAADFDAAKVKAVRAAIENGSFSVDAEAIADKLLANAQEVLSRTDH
jgi:negative regulator of flagellin synthesis FlgM